MDEFAYFHQTDVATLIHVVLFAMLWVRSIVAIDRWVSARRAELAATIRDDEQCAC
jgi:hypothetical protein